MWPLGFDYFENSRRAVLAQRAYAIRNPLDWRGYGPNIWGLTASDGPGDFELPYLGQTRKFFSLRGARRAALDETLDDGTLAPTAVLGSLPFAPEIVIPATHEMHKRYGRYIYGKYGFVDAFNPSFDYDVPLKHGRRVRGVGWVDNDYLGIDQGADHLDDRELPQRAHLDGDEAQPLPAPRPRSAPASRAAGWKCRWRSAIRQSPDDQPALSTSCGMRPATDSSVSTKLECQARDGIAPQHLEHGLVAFAPFGQRHVERLLDGVRHAARVVGIDHDGAGELARRAGQRREDQHARDRPDPAPRRIPWPPGSCRRAPA